MKEKKSFGKEVESQHEIDRQLYTTQVKLVGGAIQTAKAKYYQESLNNIDPKRTFQILHLVQQKVDFIICEKCSIFSQKNGRNTEKYSRCDHI